MPRQHNRSASGHLVHIDFSQDLPRKKIVRGVLSNRSGWLFIILRLNKNGKGGGSPEMKIDSETSFPYRVKGHVPDIVAGVLAHWVRQHILFLFSVGDVHEHVTGTTLPR